MKNKIITIVTMLFATAVFCLNSCTDKATAPFNGPDMPATITVESAGDTSATAFSVTLTPSANVAVYTYAIGTPSDYALFVSRSSTLKTIKEVNGNNDTTITFSKLTPGTEYAVFAQAYTAEGYRSEVTIFTVPTKGARVSVSIDGVNTIYAVVTTEIVGEVKEYITLTASKEAYNEFVDLYKQFGYTEIDLIVEYGTSYTANATEGWLLNGSANHEHIFVVLPYAADGTSLAISKTEFTSPAFVPGLLPPSAGSITVDNIADSSAHVVITPGEGTFGYYAGSVKDFAGITPEDWHYRMYEELPFYTSPYFGTDDDIWEKLTPGTEYVIAVTPFNVNGADGYGPYYLSASFKTTGTAPTPPAPAPAPGSVGSKHPAGNGLIIPDGQAVPYKKALNKNALKELNIKRK
ncbi:MAG: fibronectin type III domain-containing protein [Prevotellaceae bacterium]|jgi:hypothetical protein|nr:fibronectin type III domain-containing protein [Prevotellaceae bacterium]